MKWILGISLYLLICPAMSQTALQVAPDIRLPGDSLQQRALLQAINLFLSDKEKPNKENRAIYKPDLSAISLLLDEFKGMDEGSFQPYLVNVLSIPDSSFLLQCSYIGVRHDTMQLRASFTLVAKKTGDGFLLMSPLEYNTRNWKHLQLGNISFRYPDILDSAKATAYQQRCHLYETKLGMPNQQDIFYVCDNFHEVLQVSGIDYKRAYNGITYNTLLSFENGISLTVSGRRGNEFDFADAHDLWHEKLRAVVPGEKINRPVDEGCAYLYGGYGMSWEKILGDFISYSDQHPKADWISLYKSNAVFTAGKYQIAIANILNALIVEKLEKEKGFSFVMALLQCGQRKPGDENYFAALEKIAGISTSHFNSAMDQLIRQQRP